MAKRSLARARMCAIFVALVSIALVVNSRNVSARGLQVYRNPVFGFSLTTPSRFHLCRSSGETIDHDILIPLVDGAPCDHDSPYPGIGVFAAYDAEFLANTAHELAQDVCVSSKGGAPIRVERAPAELSFPGKGTFMCRESLGGKIHISLITLIGEPASPPGGTIFQMDLFTTKSRLKEDTRALREVLSGLTFTSR